MTSRTEEIKERLSEIKDLVSQAKEYGESYLEGNICSDDIEFLLQEVERLNKDMVNYYTKDEIDLRAENNKLQSTIEKYKKVVWAAKVVDHEYSKSGRHPEDGLFILTQALSELNKETK